VGGVLKDERRGPCGDLADRAIILDMGTVVFDGTAREVLDNEELRLEYLSI